MQDRVFLRYSSCFKQQVVADLENGRFENIAAARAHYGIRGTVTIQRWLKRYGKNHLRGKVVRVEKPDEADRIRQLKRQITELQQALGQTQAENVLNAQYLKAACEELGEDVERFKKKSDGGQSTPPRKDRS